MSSCNSSTLALLSLVTCLAPYVARADQILLKDGDRVTGSIVKKDGQTVTIKSKNFGLVTLKWDDIATVTTDQALNVVLPGDRTVKGNITTVDSRIQVATPEGRQTVAATEVVALRDDAEQKTYEHLLHPGLLDLWTISGSLNLAGTKGNAQTLTITTPVNFARESRTSRTTAYFNSIRSSARIGNVNSQTARAVRGGWGYNRDLTKRLFATTFNDYEYDKFQSLDLRVVLGGGLGYKLWTAEAGRLALVAGAAWNHEKFSPGTSADFTRNSAEAYWGDEFNYKLGARTTLAQTFRMFNNLSNTGAYRANFDIGTTMQLTKWLIWNLSFSDRYLSNPVTGRKKNDMLYTTGLGFAFAR